MLTSMARGHGLMCAPRQRGAYHSDKCDSNLSEPTNPVIDYCAHCLNGGTVGVVKQNLPPGGWKNYEPTKDFAGTAGRAGLCGDARGGNAHMIGGSFMPYDSVPIVEKYQSGGIADFTVEIDTNHNGYFDFYLCNLDACGKSDIAEECFTGGHCYQLQRVKHSDCEDPNVNTIYDCGPVDTAYPGRWYVPCRKSGHVGVHIVGGKSGTMRYKLPDGVECNHCVVQWYWGTANSCAPRGFLDFFTNYKNPFGTACDSDGGGLGAHRPGMTECSGSLVPEEFWSCADVQITAKGTNAGPAVGSVENNPHAPTSGDLVMESPEFFIDAPLEEDTVVEGGCLSEHAPCDRSARCCNTEQVCVYTQAASGFTCRFWWSLWQDVEARPTET